MALAQGALDWLQVFLAPQFIMLEVEVAVFI
jgi:hypothetical protein